MKNKHEVESPFPVQTPNGQTIQGEVCDCGRTRDEHQDVLGLAYGHGPSFEGDCLKFTWVRSY